MCEHLEAVHYGHIIELLMNVPPGMMKSILTNVMFPAWEWGPMQSAHLRHIGASFKYDLALRDNTKCRRLIQSEWFQKRWPIALTSDQNSKTKFENSQYGFREAMAFDSMTGSRGDRVTLDDPLSVAEALSDADLRAAETTFREAVPTRLNNEKSAKIVIMQRLHERDTSGVILSNNFGWVHLCLPMRYEPERKCSTVIGFTDPREVEDELLFPERFPEPQVKKLEGILGPYATAGQLQQSPVPRGGGMFKREWFTFVGAAPAGTVWGRGWDLAGTASQEAAYTAGVKMGRYPNGRYCIANAVRDQVSSGGMERLVVNTASDDGKHCRISLPQDPGQAGKAQKSYMISKLAGYVAQATPESGDKETRAMPLAAQAEAGNVDVIKTGDPVKDAWIEPFLSELCVFPFSKFKDQTDAASRAFQIVIQKKSARAVVGSYGN